MSDCAPIRTCVGCRRRADQPSLRRFVSSAGAWAADGAKRAPGRGAYLCSRGCAERVARNKRYPGLSAAAVAIFDDGDPSGPDGTRHMHD